MSNWLQLYIISTYNLLKNYLYFWTNAFVDNSQIPNNNRFIHLKKVGLYWCTFLDEYLGNELINK
jgi:hypothetical protein